MNARPHRYRSETTSCIVAWLLISVAPLGAQTVPTSGLVGYWRGDGNTFDSSSVGNNASTTFTGSYAAGVVGSAFSFTSGSYVSIPDNAAYNFSSGDFSVAFWFNLNNTTGTRTFLGQDNGNGTTPKWFIDYGYQNPGKFEIHLNGTGSAFLPSDAVTLNGTTWYDLAVTKTGDLYSFYLNGVAIGSQTRSGTVADPTFPLTLGFAENTLDFSGGLLDEVTLYNRALSASEVQGLYAIPESSACSVLAGLAALTTAVWRCRRCTPPLHPAA